MDPSEYLTKPKVFFFILTKLIKTQIFFDQSLKLSGLFFLNLVVLPLDNITTPPLLVLVPEFFFR